MIDAARELLADPNAQSGMRQAWADSNPGPTGGHEEGGFIVQDASGVYRVHRWPTGSNHRIILPVHLGCRIGNDNIVASFHTHPNTGDEWNQGPSQRDIADLLADPDLVADWFLGEFVVSKEWVYWADPWGLVTPLGHSSDVLSIT